MSTSSRKTTVTTERPYLEIERISVVPRKTRHRALDGDGDVLLDLDRGERGRGGDDLHLHVRDVGYGVMGRASAECTPSATRSKVATRTMAR